MIPFTYYSRTWQIILYIVKGCIYTLSKIVLKQLRNGKLQILDMGYRVREKNVFRESMLGFNYFDNVLFPILDGR